MVQNALMRLLFYGMLLLCVCCWIYIFYKKGNDK